MRLSRLVGQAASAAVDPDDSRDEAVIEAEIDRLSDDAYERLTDAEDGHLLDRPFDEVVAAICKDLRLSPEWTARVHAAVEAPSTSPIAAAMAGSVGDPPVMGPPAEEPGAEQSLQPGPCTSTIGFSATAPPRLRSG